MSKADQIFLANCQEILSRGTWDTHLPVRPRWEDGTPAHTVKCCLLYTSDAADE